MPLVRARALRRLLALVLVIGALAPVALVGSETPQAIALAVAAPDAGPAAQASLRVRLSGQRLATEVLIWLAEERGYFRGEGIEIEHVTFGSASEMIPPAGATVRESMYLRRTSCSSPPGVLSEWPMAVG